METGLPSTGCFIANVLNKKLLTNPKHLILTSPHPSPLSAYRGFFGNNHFKLANEYLIKNNETPIQWI